MATLKDIALRLRSVKNIQKITASMKMVAASKFARAERELRPARPYGKGAKGEMIDKLTLSFNRTRQAVITRELTEIISGAAAV